jgi:hypothetical protein
MLNLNNCFDTILRLRVVCYMYMFWVS